MARTPSKTETREELIVIRVSRTELHEILNEVPLNVAVSSWGRSVILDRIRGTDVEFPVIPGEPDN